MTYLIEEPGEEVTVYQGPRPEWTCEALVFAYWTVDQPRGPAYAEGRWVQR